jgi:PhnB protein
MNLKGIEPPRYNKVNPFVIIKGGAIKFIDFAEKVFGACENKQIRTPDRDGSLIHAEIQIGDSMILLADSKHDWPFTPAFLQIYVDDAQEILDRAEKEGAEIITRVSEFYNGLIIARFKDNWGNIWWVYEKINKTEAPGNISDTSWHKRSPGYIFTTLDQAMKDLSQQMHR